MPEIIDIEKLFFSEESDEPVWKPGSLFIEKTILDEAAVELVKSHIDKKPLLAINRAISDNLLTTSCSKNSANISTTNSVRKQSITNGYSQSIIETELKRKRDGNKTIPKDNKRPKVDSESNDASLKSIEQTSELLVEQPQKVNNNLLNISDVTNIQNNGGKILSNVIFVLSGYQNPLRNCLRDKAVSLGAKYRPDWSNECTHLICAYPNTPKFKEVSGKGIIVSDKWITDCFNKNKNLPWRDYRVKGSLSPSHSSTSRLFETVNDGAYPLLKKTESNDKDSHPAILNDLKSLPVLPSIFSHLHFFFYGDFENSKLQFYQRFIKTCAGTVHQYMDPAVSIVITDCVWDSNFDEVRQRDSNLRFVKSLWLDRCNENCCMIPFDGLEILPKNVL